MKTISAVVMATALAVFSFGTYAETVSATGSTLDNTEAKIAAQAKAEGASSYTIISASDTNRIFMTAELHYPSSANR
ncbi:DUF1471 domain-containing protein [Tatumella saanichensis]|uniref:DUF1471 domain-containing protein n=1 Tax=Tatumella saanichensis TaxID=480813 RepID=UPI0004A364EF|nr:DUF1471 domain-containing protein [Tatumella saanichensis]